jgi:hypothetical protein
VKTSRQIAQEFIDEQCPHLQSYLELLTQFATHIREKMASDAAAIRAQGTPAPAKEPGR